MLRPIKNDEQYEEALEKIYTLMQKDIKESSKESDALEILVILVKDYENGHFPIPKANFGEAMTFRFEQINLQF